MEKKEVNQSNQNKEYNILIENVGIALKNSRQNIANTINTEIVLTYWQIGKYIIDYEQKGNEKAEYGSNMLNKLSFDLTQKYGKGFSRSNVFYIRKFYMEYPKVQTVSELLSWSHYVELLKIEQSEERSFYEIECKKSHWGVRELKRQMKSMLFHRLVLSSDKNQVIQLANSPLLSNRDGRSVSYGECNTKESMENEKMVLRQAQQPKRTGR